MSETGSAIDRAPTTEEWMAQPLTSEDIDALETWMNREGGIKSSWPWPLIHKVLTAARSLRAERARADQAERRVEELEAQAVAVATAIRETVGLRNCYDILDRAKSTARPADNEEVK